MKKAGLIILLFIGFVVFLDKLIMPFYTSQGSVQIVPNVLNMDYEEASERLRRDGFEAIKSYHVKYLSSIDSNIVLSQIPEAGTEVKPGRNVYLVVNKLEKPTFPMPDLLGRVEFDARQTALRMEMVLQDVQVSTVTNPEQDGRVVSQSIPAQTIVRSGSSVSVVIGRYEAPTQVSTKIAVPNVLGMSLAQAQQVIAEAGLPMGRVTTEYSAFLVPNTVISQRPGVGSLVSPDQPVALTVVIMEE
jgi:eukaryotic-like serine/threonine-protein kinase